MTVKDLETLYDYGYWANKRLFDLISQLSPEQFTQPVAGSYGSIRNTLVHAMSAEWGWLDRCGGTERGPALKPDDYPTAESLIEAWGRIEAYVREFLYKLRDEDMGRYVEFTLGDVAYSIRLGDLMQHAALHAVHHRGQVALLLRLLGRAPVNFDILFYYADRRGVPSPE